MLCPYPHNVVFASVHFSTTFLNDIAYIVHWTIFGGRIQIYFGTFVNDLPNTDFSGNIKFYYTNTDGSY